MLRFSALLMSMALAVILPARGQYDLNFGGEGGGKESTTATLVPEVTAIAPGKTFTVALQLKHPAEWHSYYLNSNGVERAPELKWTLPEGFTAGPIQWPVPEVKDGYFGKSFAYSGSPVFLVDITPPASLKAGDTVQLPVTAGWQICKEMCKDEKSEFTLKLPVAPEAAVDPAKAALFKKARAAQPQSSQAWTYSVENAGQSFKLHLVPGNGAAQALDSAGIDFIPSVPFVKPFSEGGTIAREESGWLFTLQRKLEDPVMNKIPVGKEFSGILTSKSALDTTTGATALALPTLTFAKPKPAPLSLGALLPVLGGMLLGGLILNLMPCVFPVLGLKIMGFVQQSGQQRGKIVLHGLAFTGGVFLSFWVVSGILFFLREHSTADIGWGYQLQNKWFVYGLVMLFFVFGLNMFGLFEVGTSATSIGGNLQAKDGVSGSFFSGVLATIAATPCSAPILGPAIGAAVVLPTVQYFTAFTAMALGLSLPYLLLSLFPKLIGLLPRPGAWMESFKQGMAFLLLGAAGYFFWVYMDHVVPDVLFIVILGFVAIAMGAWVYGRWSTPMRTPRGRWIGRLVALGLVGAGAYGATGPYHGLEWERWSQGKVDDYLAKDTPVYVDFTAKWCATCQVNKKVAYTDEVIALFKERGIVPLRADKTKPDPEIEAKVAELGRAAIPVNVLYVPGKDPIVTPEALTPGYMKELIERNVPAKK